MLYLTWHVNIFPALSPGALFQSFLDLRPCCNVISLSSSYCVVLIRIVKSLMAGFFFSFSVWRLRAFYAEYRENTQRHNGAADTTTVAEKNPTESDMPRSPSLPQLSQLSDDPACVPSRTAAVWDDTIEMDAFGRIQNTQTLFNAQALAPTHISIVPLDVGTVYGSDSEKSVVPTVESVLRAATPSTDSAISDPETLLPPTKLPASQLMLSVVAGLFAGVFGGANPSIFVYACVPTATCMSVRMRGRC